jgi:anti-sigma B factor antagonist
MTATLTVRLVGLPLALQRKASAQTQALLRELAVLRTDSESASLLPDRLLALLEELQSSDDGASVARQQQLAAAMERGDDTIDLDYQVQRGDAEAVTRLDDLFDETDAFCRAGHSLLTVRAPRDVRALRRWAFGQFTAQAAGAAPEPWHDGLIEELGGPDDEDEAGVDAPPVVVELSGEIDLAAAPSVREALLRIVDTGVRRIDIDASRVTFLDSMGISVLLAVHLRLRERGGAVRVVRASPQIETTLRFVGIPEFLPGAG